LEILLISMQDRSTVCAECTSGMEIILGTPTSNPRWRESHGSFVFVLLETMLLWARDRCKVCQVEACFGPFEDSVSLGVR
jgi:hypothetical protein